MAKDKPTSISSYKQIPTLRLSEEDLPEIKEWSVGKEYTVTLKVRMISMNQGSEYAEEGDKPDKTVRASFKVVDVTGEGKPSASHKQKLEYVKKKALQFLTISNNS